MTATAHLYEIFIRAPREAGLAGARRSRRHGAVFPRHAFRLVVRTGCTVPQRDRRRRTVGGRWCRRDVLAATPTRDHLARELRRRDGRRTARTSRVDADAGERRRIGHARHAPTRRPGAQSEDVGARASWAGSAIIDSLKSLLETGAPLPAGRRRSDRHRCRSWSRATGIGRRRSHRTTRSGSTSTIGSTPTDDADELLQRAYAAAYHWKRATGSTAVNLARASWLVSRSHVVLGHGEVALHHADRTAHFVDRAGEDAADFDHGYAHEARARALACLGRTDEALEAYRSAAAVEIADEQDRSIYEGDLAVRALVRARPPNGSSVRFRQTGIRRASPKPTPNRTHQITTSS